MGTNPSGWFRGARRCASAGAAGLLAVFGTLATTAAEREAPTVVWPEQSLVSEAFAAALTVAVSGGPAAGATRAEPGAWPAPDAPAPYLLWADTVRAEAEGPTDGGRRAQLARWALGQGRDEDAWRHAAAAVAREPSAAPALLAAFLPGLTAPAEFGADGGLLPLPQGVALAPALPPPTERGRRVDVRTVTLQSLAIGEGAVDLLVGVRGDGVELSVEHRRGGAVEFTVELPCPVGFELRSAHADWERQDDPRAPIRVRVEPGSEPFRIWGRTEPRRPTWPTVVPTALDPRARTAGFEVQWDAPDGEAGEAARRSADDLAAGLARLLGVHARVAPLAPAAAPGVAPIRLRLSSDPAGRDRLAELLSAAEGFALRAAQ
jgi:hypothetical protein